MQQAVPVFDYTVAMLEAFNSLMERGGVVMWPLLGLSVVGVALVLERAWFWLRTNRPGIDEHLQRMTRAMRRNEKDALRTMLARDHSVYGRVVTHLLDEGSDDAVAVEAVEAQRPRIERFMGTLSTIITAAPMIGILGTVLGLIRAFRVLSASQSRLDLQDVAGPIAEALLTTAAGLVVAIVMLFPYNAFRGQIDRTYGRLSALHTAAQAGGRATDAKSES